MIIVGIGSKALIVTTYSMCISTHPENAVGSFTYGPDEWTGQAVLVKWVIFIERESVRVRIQDADASSKSSKPGSSGPVLKNAVDGISSFPTAAERPIVFKMRTTSPAMRLLVTGDVDLLTLKVYAQQIEEEFLASGIG